MEKKEFVVSVWPHVKSDESVKSIMHNVILALLPAVAAAIWFFGLRALCLIVFCSLAAVGFEILLQRWRGVNLTYTDGSALLAGLLVALNLPVSSPWWLVLIGAFVAMATKHVYGGLGFNPFNPALVARAFLLISFPVYMTSWTAPAGLFSKVDAVSTATPLGSMQMARIMHKTVNDLPAFSIMDGIIGRMAGSMGEVSFLALLIGGAYLLYKKIITWHIPVSMIASLFVFTGIFRIADPLHYLNPVVHLVTGGLMLGAFFMATDLVTSPTTPRGQIIFGIGCGVLTAVIRLWGGYPEGVSFAVLIMNCFVPLIDKYTKPVTLGYVAPANE